MTTTPGQSRPLSAVEARSRLAASAAEMIPFSCIICFDEFNTTDRPPMVLPCGHTFVCLPCTKRLKRCMECRQSLFLPPQHTQPKPESHTNNHVPQVMGSSRSTRFTPHVHPSTPPTQLKSHAANANQNPVPLPIPKNLVLLSMMEAAERQRRQMRQEQQEAEPENKKESPTRSMADEEDLSDSEEEEEAFDLNAIIAGMATLTGPCGTYAVRDPHGLVVLPHDPRRKTLDDAVLKESASTNLVSGPDILGPIVMKPANFLEESKQDPPAPPNPEMESPSSQQAHTGQSFLLQSTASLDFEDDVDKGDPNVNEVEPVRVEFGQKLQVVTFEDGVATLARNQGYICATYSQLAKVGGPLEESCRLEGLLDTIQGRGRDLQTTLQDNQRIERGLLEYIQTVQGQPPNHAVISEKPAPPPEVTRSHSADQPEVEHHVQTPMTPPLSALLQPSLQTPETDPYHGIVGPHLTDDGGYIRADLTCPAMPSSPNSIDNADLSARGNAPTSTTDHNQVALTFGCGVLPTEFLGDHHSSDTLVRGLATALDTSPTSSRHPPAAAASASFDSVNFRTGMSGHYGLSSSNKRNVKNSPTPYATRPRGRLWMMGEHRGVSFSSTPGGQGQQQQHGQPRASPQPRASAARYHS
eukprot:CAMPEP_0172454638 /NCGR_PEP_ID=MMETSP1065-20121228/11563_1 /TAXON_ID=265537 /ORGANISM="Amphiprora paludosa, Strain CCMP125" /LENGTH=639 /DNA_ID=CAMNT_0013206993 /DNA_START=354 /DNA_END=2273 /DNA_ORIENTATION=+